jgi:hypothetical protein
MSMQQSAALAQVPLGINISSEAPKIVAFFQEIKFTELLKFNFSNVQDHCCKQFDRTQLEFGRGNCLRAIANVERYLKFIYTMDRS